jgi:pyrroloquinoline quinone (PQQ) biosynthesis protein C
VRNSDALRGKIELARAGLRHSLEAFWNHRQMVAIFPELLFTNYSISRATTHLMATVNRAARIRFRDDVAEATARFLECHMAEEQHHDEWMLEDIAALGIEPKAVLERLPSPNVAAMVGAQYYWACHVHPAALFGYLVVIETPPDAALLEEVAGMGVPRAALRSYFRHAELDQRHAREIDAALDAMLLSVWQNSVIAVSAFQTIYHMGHAFEELVEMANAVEATVAASA